MDCEVHVVARISEDRHGFRRELVGALRNLHRRERLSASPLLGARFVRRWGTGVGVERLRSALAAGLCRLATSPCDERAAALLEAAFIEVPRRKQLAIACALGMGFSTYRRHLAAAIDALVDVLTDESMPGMIDHATSNVARSGT